MNLNFYVDIFRRRLWIILTVAIVAILAYAAAEYFLVARVYSATTTVNVVPDVGVTNSGLYQDYTVRMLNTYAYMLQSNPFLEAAIKQLPKEYSTLPISEVKKRVKIKVDTLLNTSILLINVQSQSPALARDMANTMATVLVNHGRDFLLGNSKSTLKIFEDQLAAMEADLGDAQVKYTNLAAQGNSGSEARALADQIKSKQDAYSALLNRYEMQKAITSSQANNLTVISPALLPGSPINGLGLTQLGLALVVGLFAGITTGLVIENLDTRIYSLEQLKGLSGIQVLGAVPNGLLFHSKPNKKTNERLMDAYHLLAFNYRSLCEESGNVLLVTSAAPKEGKSTVAVNLAQAFSEEGQSVLLVEGDLRNPTFDKLIGVDGDSGLATLLETDTPFSHELTAKSIHPTKLPNLWTIGAGTRVANPVALFASPRMDSLVDYLRTQNKMIVMDSSSVLGRADVSVLASKVDSIIFVVKQGTTKKEQVIAAVNQLQANHSRILGFVFLGNHN